ncbi:MAG: hypothetical protein LBN30_01790 [Oscillospiraceae bacterium]|jgi:hypothetical protein|nr:hypothetical protein [Oscillospiraceae bacterium]
MKKVLALAIVIVMMLALATVASAAYEKPADLASYLPFDDGTAFGGAASATGGLWSGRPAGAYDPTLDTLSIPDEAYVYTTAGAAAPSSIAGYTKVSDIGSLAAGEWALYEYESVYGPTGYIILVPASDAPAPAAPEEPSEPVEEPEIPTAPSEEDDAPVTLPATVEPAAPATAAPAAPTAAPAAPAAPSVPKTADSSSALWVVLALVATAGVVVLKKRVTE